jgi:hypothetical protein
MTRLRQPARGLLPLWLAIVCFAGIDCAAQTATSAQLDLAFNPAAVGIGSGAAQQLTASFTVSGSATPTATLHYGIDYTLAVAITCAPSAGSQVCTVPVIFTPALPGARKDALFLKDGSTTLATVYLGGVGQSPLAQLQPGVVTPLVSGATYDQRESAVDENGTVYVLSPNSPTGSNVYSVTKAGVVSVVPVTVSAPTGIAIDGAGILYIPSAAPGSMLITWNTVTQTQNSVSAALPPPYPCAATTSTPEQLSGAAVDAFGDVYTLDEVCQSIIEVRPNGTTVVNAVSPVMNADPTFIAVDSSGNVFVSCIDTINEQLASSSQSAITNPGDPETSQLQVDPADSLYVVPHSGGGVVELPPSNYESPQGALDPAAVIAGIGLGSDGTLYVGNLGTSSGVGNGNLDKVDRSQGAIAFGQQVFGTASASQQVALYNGGNDSLTVSNVALTGSSSGYALEAAATNNCSSGLVLAPGSYCQVAASLTPAQVGNLTGSIVFSTNSLNNASSIETVALSGFVPGSYATLSPNPVAFGNQDMGTTSTAATVTLSNTGTVELTSILVSLTGANTSDFAISTGANACGSSLAIGASCSIYVTFTPSAAANYMAVLSVADNAANSSQTATLTGTGIPPLAIMQIDELIHTTDAPELGSSVAMNIVETIHTADARALGSSVAMNIDEAIHTTDTDTLTAVVTPTQTSLASSVDPSVAGQSVIFTATVSSAAGIPPGTVQFNINGAAAGSPVPLNAAGQALYSTAALADGANSITATYSGNISFLRSMSNTLAQSVLDFAFTTGSTPSETIFPGQSAAFQFAIAPQGAFGDTITFSATGLPPGATAAFNPSSVTPSSTSSTVTMTIQTAKPSAALHSPWPSRSNYAVLLGVLLPLCGIRRVRRTLKRSRLFLAVVFSFGIALGLSGCAGDGFFNQPPQTYTITVTATSGSLQHSTTVSLTVE